MGEGSHFPSLCPRPRRGVTELLTMDTAALIVAMLCAGAVAGVAAGLFGIGGGFVVVPALLAIFNILGVESDVAMHLALGTSLGTIILTSMRSVQAHAKRGAVDFTIIRDWAPWIVIGVILGLGLASSAPADILKIVFGVGVLILSVNFLFPTAFKGVKLSEEMPKGIALAAIATFLGGFSALLGIGGGTIAILVMTMCGRSIHQAVATAAGFGAIIAIPGTIGWAIVGWNETGVPPFSIGYINLIGLVAIASMSMLTAPYGAALAHKLNPMSLKRVFGAYLVFTSVLMLKDVAFAPVLMHEPTEVVDIDAHLPAGGANNSGAPQQSAPHVGE